MNLSYLPPREKLYTPATYKFQILSKTKCRKPKYRSLKKKSMENWQTAYLCHPSENMETRRSPNSPKKLLLVLKLLCDTFYVLCISLHAQDSGSSPACSYQPPNLSRASYYYSRTALIWTVQEFCSLPVAWS